MLSQSLAVTAQELKRVDKMTLQLQGSCIQRWEVIEYIKKKKKRKREKWRCLSTLKGFLLGDQKENCTFRKPVHIYLSYLHRLGSKSHKILLWFSNKSRASCQIVLAWGKCQNNVKGKRSFELHLTPCFCILDAFR